MVERGKFGTLNEKGDHQMHPMVVAVFEIQDCRSRSWRSLVVAMQQQKQQRQSIY
jgi:hypothetical protein